MIARRGRQAGVDLYPHRFRHHFSHTWLDRGGPEGDLIELNGWTSPQMLSRYDNTSLSTPAPALGIGSPEITPKNKPGREPGQSTAGQQCSLSRESAPGNFSPKTLNDQLRELLTVFGVPHFSVDLRKWPNLCCFCVARSRPLNHRVGIVSGPGGPARGSLANCRDYPSARPPSSRFRCHAGNNVP
jgi:hypothetical protein